MEPYCVLSFDVEEHHRIEAAAGLCIQKSLAADYRSRMQLSTWRLLEQLAKAEVRATFFVVGDIARNAPGLIRDIYAAGHEVGSHGWNHTRVDHFNSAAFRQDAQRSRDALEQVISAPVYGFRAPTFSITRKNSWAIDVLAECGYQYDSSIFPVHHDRYGVADAPRGPFHVSGRDHELLELPPLTYRTLGYNLPVAGGGYFRLFPLGMMRAGIRQAMRCEAPSVAMLYFHPWEFDEDQPRLPLGRLSRWRTYVGIRRTTGRLQSLLGDYPFVRAIDAARAVEARGDELPRFELSAGTEVPVPVLRQSART